MKNIILYGDSIRMGYDGIIRKVLENDANIYSPYENCRFAPYLYRHIFEWNKEFKVDGKDIDIVHWNVGIWDIARHIEDEPQTPLSIYKYYIEKICLRLKTVYPNAKLIFATTTPVMEEEFEDPKYLYIKNEDIETYNKEAVSIVKKHGGIIDDIHSVAVNADKDIFSNRTHFYTRKGIDLFTKTVLKSICENSDIKIDIDNISYDLRRDMNKLVKLNEYEY